MLRERERASTASTTSSVRELLCSMIQMINAYTVRLEEGGMGDGGGRALRERYIYREREHSGCLPLLSDLGLLHSMGYR